jgi:hypothetical protein
MLAHANRNDTEKSQSLPSRRDRLIFVINIFFNYIFFCAEVTIVRHRIAFFFLISAIGALYVWHHPKAPETPAMWLRLALYSVVAAVLWFGLTRLGAHFMFIDEPPASRAFDLVVTVIIAPGLTITSAVGWIRALALQLLSRT